MENIIDDSNSINNSNPIGERRAELILPVIAEKAKHSAGQRRVNILWEMTQAIIAITVTGSTLFVAAQLTMKENSDTAPFLLLSNAFFLVVGFYFGRTNHQRVGGVDLGR